LDAHHLGGPMDNEREYYITIQIRNTAHHTLLHPSTIPMRSRPNATGDEARSLPLFIPISVYAWRDTATGF
jgi:hypothetical protein